MTKRFPLVLIVALGCCAAPGPMSLKPASTVDLIGHWQLSAIDNQVVAPRTLTVSFDRSGTVGGTLLCNGFGGQYALVAGRLTFRQLDTTTAGCIGPGYDALQDRAELFLSASNAPVAVVDSALQIDISGMKFSFRRS